MRALNKKIVWIAAAAALLVALAGGGIGVYAWYQSQTDVKVVYQIPTDNSLIIEFDSSVTKDVKGTLYPAVLDPDAVRDNAADDPARIAAPTGRASFEAQFTMYGGTSEGGTNDEAQKEIELSLSAAARIQNGTSARDLLKTGELAVQIDFEVGAAVVRLDGTGTLYAVTPSGPVALGKAGEAGKTAYLENGTLKVADTVLPGAGKTVVAQNGFLVVLTDQPIRVKTEAYLTTPDVLTAKDLKKSTVRIALSVVRVGGEATP